MKRCVIVLLFLITLPQDLTLQGVRILASHVVWKVWWWAVCSFTTLTPFVQLSAIGNCSSQVLIYCGCYDHVNHLVLPSRSNARQGGRDACVRVSSDDVFLVFWPRWESSHDPRFNSIAWLCSFIMLLEMSFLSTYDLQGSCCSVYISLFIYPFLCSVRVADPASDVEGLDVQQKLAILTKLCFGFSVPPSSIPTEGITKISR